MRGGGQKGGRTNCDCGRERKMCIPGKLKGYRGKRQRPEAPVLRIRGNQRGLTDRKMNEKKGEEWEK